MREYKRKTNQQGWSEENMKSAIAAVRMGNLSQNKAAKQFEIPIATLYRRVKSEKGDEEAAKKKLGRFITVFNTDQERTLVNYLLEMDKRFFGLSYKELRTLAYQYAEVNNIPNNFNKEHKTAGRDWLYLFLKRHPELTLRTPENTSAARAAGFNKVSVEIFYNLLGELYDKYSFRANNIYNCDETGITTVPNKPIKVISLKGKKQVGSFSSSERGLLVTAEICFSASGHYIPPLLIIPRVRRNPIYEVGLLPETVVAFHKSGWMQSDIFCDIWFTHFLKHARPNKENPILLILDGHATHVKNLKLIERARENNVHILCLPPHTSHKLQPLDVSFMFPLSNFYTQELKNWQRNKQNKIIELSDVGQIFGKACSRAATLANAENGFRSTGIYPYNAHLFTDIDFTAATLTEREDPNHAETSLLDRKNNSVDAVVFVKETSPCCTTVTSPEDIMPIPKVIPKQITNRCRQRGKTAVITASPYMNELKDNQTKLPAKSIQQVKRKLLSQETECSKKFKCNDNSTDSEDYETDHLCEDDSNSDYAESKEIPDMRDKQEQIFTLVQREIVKDDFILVSLKEEKKQTEKEFVAKVIRVVEEIAANQNTSYEVKFMRNYRSHYDTFIFPDVDDISIIYNNEIKGVLTHFSSIRYGKIVFK